MPRFPAQTSIDDIVRTAMDDVIKRASVAIASAIAEMAAERLDHELQTGVTRALTGGRSATRRTARQPRTDITRWVADRRARRVPNFVIEATGLKTKKQIVAKYGEDVAFEKGRPLPKPE